MVKVKQDRHLLGEMSILAKMMRLRKNKPRVLIRLLNRFENRIKSRKMGKFKLVRLLLRKRIPTNLSPKKTILKIKRLLPTEKTRMKSTKKRSKKERDIGPKKTRRSSATTVSSSVIWPKSARMTPKG